MARRITEYLEIDLERRAVDVPALRTRSGRRARHLQEGLPDRPSGSARNPPPVVEGEYGFAPDADWCRIVEFYLPGLRHAA